MPKTGCINPSQIEEGDLIAYLHGEAAPEVCEHIARCAYCADQVEQLRLVDAQLLAAFYRDDCPSPEVLADLVLDRLPAVERLRVAAHVRGCPACAEEVAAVRDLAGAEPPSLLTRLREALALALLARPVAGAPAPVRGEEWQARFEVDDLVVTLSLQAGRLTGRVRQRNVPPDTDYSGQVWLLGEKMLADEEIPSSEIDERGRFYLSLPTGGPPYALLLQTRGRHVAIENIDCSPSRRPD